MSNQARFYIGLSGYYMVYINYIVALTSSEKIIQLKLSSSSSMIQDHYSHIKIIHINHSIIYYFQNESPFAAQMLLKLQKVVNNRVLLRFYSDSVLFRVFIGKVLFLVFSHIVLFRVLSMKVFLRVLGLRVFSGVISSLFPVCLLKLINKYVQQVVKLPH